MNWENKHTVTAAGLILSALAGIGTTFTLYTITRNNPAALLVALIQGYIVASATGMVVELTILKSEEECDFCG